MCFPQITMDNRPTREPGAPVQFTGPIIHSLVFVVRCSLSLFAGVIQLPLNGFLNSSTYKSCGHWKVQLPWREEALIAGDEQPSASARLSHSLQFTSVMHELGRVRLLGDCSSPSLSELPFMVSSFSP